MKIVIFSCVLVICFAFEDKTVTEYLTDNGYSKLTEALQYAGLASVLDGSGPYTIFAPRDVAFNGINISSFTREQLATILKYHVVSEFVLVPMIRHPMNKTTLETQDLLIEPSGGSMLLNGNAHVDTSHNDIIVSNGVVQPIDKLMYPPVFAQYNIFQVLLRADDQFLDLTLALLLADLYSTLEGSEFTLFAPTDAAFAEYKDNLLNPSDPNAQQLYREVLKNHMVPGGRSSAQLRDGMSMYTLHGTPLTITLGAGLMVNHAHVVQADMVASNGYIHAIDKLLIPQDINQIVGGR